MRLPDLSRHQILILFVALVLCTAIVRIHDVAHVPPGAPADSTTNLADALRISRGIPFPAYFTDRPELIERYLLAGWFVLTGPHIFSTQTFQLFFGLLALALTYRAGLILLAGHPWRRLGSLIATGALASVTFLVFLTRASYRAVMLPPIVLLILVLSPTVAEPRRQWWRCALIGFLAGLAMHIYSAGLVTPLWAIVLLIHQLLTRRQVIRSAVFTAAGIALPLLAWLVLVVSVPDLYEHTLSIRSKSGLSFDAVLNGLSGSFREYFLEGHHMVTFNTPYTALLNPFFGFLTLIGFILILRHWRKPQVVLLISGIFLFSLPGALSEDPSYPVRLVGSLPLLALLAGYGAACLVASVNARTPYAQRVGKLAAATAATALIVFSLTWTYSAYFGLFADPAHYQDSDVPFNLSNIPQAYTVAFTDALKWLSKVDKPTYMPLWLLDNPAAAFFIQKEAFPNVTTWARYGLKELPEGQFFFPAYWYYHFPLHDETAPFPQVNDTLTRVLLLPDQKTIVILPATELPPDVIGPGVWTNDIKNDRGWTIAHTRPVHHSAFTPPQISGAAAPMIGNGLRLLTPAAVQVQPGKSTTVLLNWLVTAPQPADLFSVAQLLRPDMTPVAGGSDHYIMQYFYPSARWQPGDVIPDRHTLSVPTDLPNGIYRLGAGAYVPPGQRRLSVIPPDSQDWGPQLPDLWQWGSVRLPLPPTLPLPQGVSPLNARFGEHLALDGYQVVSEPGSLRIVLYWRSLSSEPSDYVIFVHAQHGETLIAQQDEKPAPPTWAWLPGELVTTSYTLALPSASPQPDTIKVGMYSYPSLERLKVIEDGVVKEDRQVSLR